MARRINRKIRDQIIKKLGSISIRRMYQRIEKIRNEYGKTIDIVDGAYILASTLGIDLAKHLPPEEVDRIREIISKGGVTVVHPTTKKSKVIQKLVSIGSKPLPADPLLPTNVVEDARKMAQEVYPRLYIFENSVRNVISRVLTKNCGSDWWNRKVSKKIRDKVRDRRKRERENAWHGKRGYHEIYYTDLNELKDIIQNNWQYFKQIFNSQSFVIERIQSIYISRNIVAHNNPLSDRDIKRLVINFEDWLAQIKSKRSLIE